MSQILENPLPLSVDLEKEMTTHSSILTWRVPWTKEPGRLQSMGVAKSQKPLSDYHSLTECRLNLEHHHESVICSVVSNTFATP